jgi:hypothetical protein
VKASRLAFILLVASAFGVICYLAVRHYSDTLESQSLSFEVRDPCHPRGLYATPASALPTDAAIQQKLAGTWWHSSGPYYGGKDYWCVSQVSVGSNGDYVCHFRLGSGVVRSNVIQGHWRVKDGLLFDTITNYFFGSTNEPVLHVFSNRVLRITDRELVCRGEPDGGVVLYRRVRPAR